MTKPQVQVGDTFVTNEGYECKVIGYRNCKEVDVEFMTDKKYMVTTETKHVKTGAIKYPYRPTSYGKGYYGVGQYKANINNCKSMAYRKWSSMLKRCYCPKYLNKNPTYRNSIVCDEWLNFQNFAAWFYEQNKPLDYELDKDLFGDGSLYSPETCRLIPCAINSAIKKRSNNGLPSGVEVKKDGYLVSMVIDGEKRDLGVFDDIGNALKAFNKEKLLHIKNIANEYKDVIDTEIYSALMQWRFY